MSPNYGIYKALFINHSYVKIAACFPKSQPVEVDYSLNRNVLALLYKIDSGEQQVLFDLGLLVCTEHALGIESFMLQMTPS